MIYTEPGGRMEAELVDWRERGGLAAADRRLHGRQVHGRRGDAGDELRPRRHDRRRRRGLRDPEDRQAGGGRDPGGRADRRDPRGRASSRASLRAREVLEPDAGDEASDGVFIDVEVSDEVAGDAELARKLEEVCPVDIFTSEDSRVETVAENLDECVLCELCIEAAPPRRRRRQEALRRHRAAALSRNARCDQRRATRPNRGRARGAGRAAHRDRGARRTDGTPRPADLPDRRPACHRPRARGRSGVAAGRRPAARHRHIRLDLERGRLRPEGAEFATELLRGHGWEEQRIRLCSDAIECHHQLRYQWQRGAEVELIRRADLVEVLAGRVRFGLSRESGARPVPLDPAYPLLSRAGTTAWPHAAASSVDGAPNLHAPTVGRSLTAQRPSKVAFPGPFSIRVCAPSEGPRSPSPWLPPRGGPRRRPPLRRPPPAGSSAWLPRARGRAGGEAPDEGPRLLHAGRPPAAPG